MDCNCSCVHSDLSLMDEVLDTYADTKGSLITILQKAQEIYGYLPLEVQEMISLGLDIPLEALRRFTPSSACSRSVNI